LSRGGSIGLGEGRKNLFLPFQGNTDSCISHSEPKRQNLVILRLHLNRESHFAGAREFDRVSYQVHDNLAQPHRVARDDIGNCRIHVPGKRQGPLLRSNRKGLKRVRQIIPQAEGDPLQIQLPCLNLREVQDVIEQRQ